MKKIVQNSFGKGLNMDLNPLTTPRDVLTDCLNGTVITYNGDEFSLQTEMGNSRVIINGDSGTDPNALPQGFIPLGVKEFNNILYIVAHNPVTKESRVGSFPSPQRYVPMQNNETENLVKRTVPDIQTYTNTLVNTDYINHGMNTLSSFIRTGDKYRVVIKMGAPNTTPLWGDVEPVLEKFINNYGTGGTGYFDLKYYTYNSEGIYTEIPININPGVTSSDVRYLPEPSTDPNYINGNTQVNTKEGNSVIIAALIPKTIEGFDFRLQGYNTLVLGAKVVFDANLVKDSNSAIKVTTIKIVTSNTEFDDVTTSYYDYATYTDTETTIIQKSVSGTPTDFIIGTTITVTCTPIDQFGRELTSFAVTKTYEVTDLLLGVASHNLFKYKIVGNILTLKYNFLNEGSGITDTQVEFYDFWSGVSILSTLIPFTVPLDKEVTVDFNLTNLYPKTQTFNSIEKGGIPVSTLSAPVVGENVLGTYITNTDVRTDHCYLVRIFGITNTGTALVDLSVFQLLYTLPIAEFTSSYLSVDNFGTIDITNGISVNPLLSDYNGTIFTEPSITSTPTTPVIKNEYGNYTRDGVSVSEAYRLYGGPVFEEERDGLIATWKNGNRYYRNAYTKGFEREELNLSSLGYHNFPESSIRNILTIDSSTGTSLPETLFTDGSKHYLKGGLVAPGTSSQKDFRFHIVANMAATAPTYSGTVTIFPKTIVGPVFFGYIDMASLNKTVTLGTYTSPAITNLDITYTLPPSSITENLVWSTTTVVNPNSPAHSAKVRVELISGDTTDNFYVRDFELASERFTYSGSGFKYYRHKSPKNKLFSYFSLNHIQTVKVKLDSISDLGNVSAHQEYLFSGVIDQNVDVEFTSTSVSTRNSIVTPLPAPPPLDTQLVWSQSPGAFDLNTFIGMAGCTSKGVSPNTTVFVNNNAAAIGTKNVEFYLDSYSQGQYMYSTFKTDMPTQYKVNIPGDSYLYTYNNMWRWGDPLNNFDSYVAVEDAISRDYLSNLIMYQSYQEIILAQYPKGNAAHNTTSVSSVTVSTNNLQYFISTSASSGDKHLTKSCFGSGTMEAFNINKFSSIIRKWNEANPVVTKIVYDFTNIDISEGLAKNIPWNFADGLINTTDIADLTLNLSAASPQAHINLFANAETAVNSSSYLTNVIAPTSFKIIKNAQAVDVSTSYFVTRESNQYSNVNASSFLLIPKLNRQQMLTRAITIDSSHGISSVLLNPPSLDQIYGGFNVAVGDYFGGGVVIKVNLDPLTKRVIGGLIGAVSNGTIAPPYVNASYFYERLSGGDPYSTGATSTTDGWDNTKKLLANARSKDQAVKYCTDYRGGGYNDWYMPSQEELRTFLTFDKTHAAALPTAKSYWSSTEISWDRAVVCARQTNGVIDVYTYKKNNLIPVIPIRKF